MLWPHKVVRRVMAAHEVKRATENLTCPICCQLYRNPKYLPCYHFYCEECLEKIHKQSRITCPECRKETTVPSGGVKELPNNFLINRLKDDLVLKRRDEEKVMCDECNNDETMAYCPNCNLFLCQACYGDHKETNACHNIDTVSLSSSHSSNQSPGFTCEEHGYELKHYCETCDMLVCLYCTMKQHNDHDHDILKKKAGKQRDEMRRIAAPLGGMAENLHKACNDFVSLKKRTEELDKEIDEKINQHYDKLFQKLMAQKEQLKMELSIAVSQVRKIAITQEKEINSVLDRLLKIKEVNQSIEEGSDQQALSTKHQLVNSMKALDDIYKKLNLLPPSSPVITYSSACESLPQFDELSVFGKPLSLKDVTNSTVENIPRHIFVGKEVEVKIVSKDHNGHNCPVGGCQVSVQLETSTGDVTAACVRDNNDGNYMASFVAKQVGEAKLSVAINGKQIKGSPYHFTVYKNYLAHCSATKTLGVDGNVSLGNPWGIAFSNNGTWAVTDNSNHCVYIFNCKDQLVRKIGQGGYRKGQFQSPRGIAFDNNNHFYVADYKNDRVQKFSMDGKYLLQLDSYSLSLNLASKFYKMNFPTGVTTYDNQVYVTEKATRGYVSVFLSTGSFRYTIGSKELSDPYDVMVRADGQLLVADCVKNCIFMYTPEGVYLRKFSTGGTGRGQLNSPFSLTTDENLFTFVADTWNHRVTIFDKDGYHVHSFGSEGCTGHQMKRPHAIALSPYGKIYLSDYGNSRIQIF